MFSSPIRLVTGTRTSRKNVSLVRYPDQAYSGGIDTPGLSTGTMITEIPRWRGASGSVRTHSHSWVDLCAPLFQIFDPLITHSSPSRTARVRRLARSVPAFGSE